MGTLFGENRAGSGCVSGEPQHDIGSGTNGRRCTVHALSRRKEEELYFPGVMTWELGARGMDKPSLLSEAFRYNHQ
jgi:hypothetical protein